MNADDGRAGPLSPDQVRSIRRQADTANWLRILLAAQPTLEQIAEREGVTLRVVRGIVSRQRYRWVPEEVDAGEAAARELEREIYPKADEVEGERAAMQLHRRITNRWLEVQ